MIRPLGPIVMGKFPCIVCGAVRHTALGAWGCWRLHQIEADKRAVEYIISTEALV